MMMRNKYVMTMPIVISLSGYASFSFLRNVVQLLFLHHHLCDLGQIILLDYGWPFYTDSTLHRSMIARSLLSSVDTVS